MTNRSNYSVAALAGMIIGGISAQGRPTTMLAALMPFMPRPEQQASAGKAEPAPSADASQTVQATHLGAESPELRALRRAESQLFPELGPLDVSAPNQAPAVCAAPEAESWQMSQSPPEENRHSWPAGLKVPGIPV